jgi:hypothetical protein
VNAHSDAPHGELHGAQLPNNVPLSSVFHGDVVHDVVEHATDDELVAHCGDDELEC